MDEIALLKALGLFGLRVFECKRGLVWLRKIRGVCVSGLGGGAPCEEPASQPGSVRRCAAGGRTAAASDSTLICEQSRL